MTSRLVLPCPGSAPGLPGLFWQGRDHLIILLGGGSKQRQRHDFNAAIATAKTTNGENKRSRHAR